MVNIFSNREDIVKRYSERRKNLSEEEAEDLLNCLLGYLKKITSDKETYAVKIGSLGFMYKKFSPERKKSKNLKMVSNHELIDKMIVELCINNDNRLNPLIRQSFLDKEYKGMSIEEIQDIQNA